MSNALRLGSFMVAARVERGEPEQVYVLASDYDALAARLADEQARSGDRLVELTQAQARLAEAVAAAKTWENEAERRSRRYEQAAVKLAEAERLLSIAVDACRGPIETEIHAFLRTTDSASAAQSLTAPGDLNAAFGPADGSGKWPDSAPAALSTCRHNNLPGACALCALEPTGSAEACRSYRTTVQHPHLCADCGRPPIEHEAAVTVSESSAGDVPCK